MFMYAAIRNLSRQPVDHEQSLIFILSHSCSGARVKGNEGKSPREDNLSSLFYH